MTELNHTHDVTARSLMIVSPSLRKSRCSPFGSSGGSRPAYVSSMSAPASSAAGPETVHFASFADLKPGFARIGFGELRGTVAS
jgi:hypothetical protein